jgi:hypothetical protein
MKFFKYNYYNNYKIYLQNIKEYIIQKTKRLVCLKYNLFILNSLK